MEYNHPQRTTQEVHGLQELCFAYCQEENLVADPKYIEQYVASVLDGAQVILAKEGGDVVGMIAWIITPHIYTGLSTMKKIAWYVFPQHRGKIGMELLKQAEQSAKEAGALVSFVSVKAGMKMPKDYQPFETEFVRIL